MNTDNISIGKSIRWQGLLRMALMGCVAAGSWWLGQKESLAALSARGGG